jgi:hypothetical protein
MFKRIIQSGDDLLITLSQFRFSWKSTHIYLERVTIFVKNSGLLEELQISYFKMALL